MKRILPFLLSAILLTVCLSGCAHSRQIGDLSRTSYIEVRAFSMTEQRYTDYVISDVETVDGICAAFAELSLERIKNTEPLMTAYELQFYNHSHAPVDSITVLTDGTMLKYDGQLYSINADIKAYIDAIVATLEPVNIEES